MSSDRRSRCTIPDPAGYEWIDFIDYANEFVLEFHNWILGLSEFDRELVIGRILGLREIAANGEIDNDDGKTLKPIRLDPDLFELRWDELGTLIRQYHAEPRLLPNSLIMLHMHMKHVAPESESLTRELQDQQISWALMRYRAGETRLWTK